MEFKIEVSDEELAEKIETNNFFIIKEILRILRSYDVRNPESEDFRCIEEIVCLLEDNGYNPCPCHDF